MRALRSAALALLFVVVAAPAAELGVMTFRAPMDRVREAKALLKDGFKVDEEVEVSERALVFAPPLAIADLRSGGTQAYPEVAAVVAYLQANLSGTPEQMADFWVPEERAARLKDMRDAEKLKAVRAFLARFPGISVVAIVQQPTTATVYLARGAAVQGIHLQRGGERLLLTSTPDNDLSLAIVEGALLGGSYE